MKNNSIAYGSDKPGKLFSEFYEKGERELVALKEILDQDKKEARTWGIRDTAKLIGRSEPWLRTNDKDVPKNKSGHGRWTLERINGIRDKIGNRFKRPKGTKPFILSVINFKGGVGKTTTQIHLAQRAAIRGVKVLAIDLDPQASSTYNLGNLIPDVDLSDEDIINQALLSDDVSVEDLILKTNFHGVDIIPTNLALQHMDLVLPNLELNNHKEMGAVASRLQKAIAPVINRYDLIIIDCPPNMGSITLNGLCASNGLIIPVPPASFDRASFVTFTSSLEFFYTQSKLPLDYLRIMITQHGNKRSDNFHESRIRKLYTHVLSNNFYKSAEIEKASTEMKSIYDLERPINDKATHTRALDTVNAVMDEVLDELNVLWGVDND